MPLMREMPGFDDWVELHRPGLSEDRAQSLGEMPARLEAGAELTRQMTFEYCDLMLELRRRVAERRQPSAPVAPTRITPNRGEGDDHAER